MNLRLTLGLTRALPTLAALLSAALAAGCAAPAAPGATASAVALPAPPPGNTAWQVVSNGGEKKYGATVPDATPWITVGPDGAIRAQIPASEQSKAAKPGLEAQNLGALTIRRAP